MTKPRIHVPAIGGAHQFAHFLPVAFELHQRGLHHVEIFVTDSDDAEAVRALAASLGHAAPAITVMALPRAIRLLPRAVHKISRILLWAGRLRECDALFCAERTSTILKRLPGRCPPMIHIPHGAGDRAVGFENRFRLFDLVLVAGAKDRDRLMAEGVVDADRCRLGGPVKLASLMRTGLTRPPLFDNDRPVILYNPHFNRSLGSFDRFTQALVDAVLADGRYNLVIAPHVRLAASLDRETRQRVEGLARPGRIIVDFGSSRSIDMSYTLAADLYVGDVSSQLYEYLVRPRPCLFLNAHDVAWQGSEDYAMWQLGPVTTPGNDLITAIDGAFADFAHYRTRQEDRLAYAYAGLMWNEHGSPMFDGPDPIAHCADLITDFASSRR